MSTRKVVAIGLVALLHALLGYAFITGLAYNVVKKIAADTKVFDVAEEPPPPEETPPPPPPETKVEPPPVVVPPPIVAAPTVSAPPIIANVPKAPAAPVITPTAPPAPPPPPKPSIAAKATARGNPGSWVTTEDYPSRALREEREGSTTISFDIDPTGKAVNCQIANSSGSPDLDDATCKNFTRRARYKPAQDASGNPITQPGQTQRIRWQIPKE